MKSIQSKIVVYLILLVVVSVGLASGVGYYVSSGAIIDEVDKGLAELALEASSHINSQLNTHITFLLAQSERRFVDDPSLSRAEKIALYQHAADLGGFTQFVIADVDGEAFLSTGDTANIVDREYFQTALQGEAAVSDVIIHKLTNEPVLTVAVPIEREEGITGVLVGVKDGNALSDIVEGISYGETGYTFMINEQGTNMAHVNRDLVTNQYSPIVDLPNNPDLQQLVDLIENRIITGESGTGEYYFNNKNVRVGFTPVNDGHWFLVTAVDESEALAPVKKLLNYMLLIGVFAAILGMALAYLLSKDIAKPISVMAARLERLAAYDLTMDNDSEDLAYANRKDEVGLVARSLAKMQQNLISLIKDTSDLSEQVAAASEELMATGQELSTTSEEVGRTVEEIAIGSSTQARDTEEGALQVNALGDLVTTNVNQLTELQNASSEIVKLKDDGIRIMTELVDKTQRSAVAAQEINEVISETDKSATDIGKASNMIKGIADQTNLLALNAAIEAARAGEAGRGFAVVADEIRELAEQSNKFADEISETINTLMQKTEHGVKRMADVAKIMESQTQSVDMSNNKFEGIAEAIERSADIIQELNETGLEMNQKREEINNVLQTLAAVAEENAAGTEETSAAMEEQIAAIQEMSRASEQMAKLAEQVQENISKFKF